MKIEYTWSKGSSTLCSNSEVFDCCDMKKDLDFNILHMFENIHANENDFVMGSSNEFSDIDLDARCCI